MVNADFSLPIKYCIDFTHWNFILALFFSLIYELKDNPEDNDGELEIIWVKRKAMGKCILDSTAWQCPAPDALS